METKKVKPFGIMDKLGYMFGDFGNDFTFILASMIMMKFYTDVVGISAGIVGILMMVARFVDAFTDVAMGQIVDRSKPTAAGKFKPWLVRMCGPVAVASFLIYGNWIAAWPYALKVVYMFVTYILWGSVFYTSINIPYGSMASAITADPEERSALSTFRTMGGSLAGLVIGVVLPLIIYDKMEVEGVTVQVMNGGRVTVVAGICSLAAIGCYLLCYNMITERVKVEQKTEKFDLGKLINGLVHNKSLIGIVVASICMLLVQLTLSTLTGYLYPDYFGNTTVQAASSMLTMIPVFVLAPIAPKLSGKFGKKELAIVGSIFGGVVFAIAFVLQTENPWVFAICNAVAYCGLALFQLICWAMITDVIDDTEVKTGARSDGEIYSVYSFARKMGQALAAGVGGALLTMIGYDGTALVQTDSVKQGIYNLSCLVPAIGFILLAIVLIFLYPLGKKEVDENVRILAEKQRK